MTGVRYQPTDPAEYSPPETHTALGDGEYLAPDDGNLDVLEINDVIEVLDWNYETDGDGGETPVRYHGPPEPIVDDDGTVSILYPADEHTAVKDVQLGTFVCKQCGTEQVVPVRNGTLNPPQACEGCERKGPFYHKALDEYPDLAPSTFANPQWYPPSDISDKGYETLWADVRDWIHTNWVSDEPHLYDGLTAFAISTWLRPNFNFLPQLMVMGKHETGKTRLLTTIARIAYRGRVPVSFTPAAIFRTVDKYHITLFLSEYHDLNPDLRDEVNAVIKGSQKRGEDVMRTEKGPEGGYEPANFNIFTHVALGTQFDPPDDIISRCIKIQTKPADRDVPVWFDEDRATSLRNRLLYARYRLLESDEWAAAEQRALAWLNDRGVSGRLREKLLSLVTVAEVWDERDAIEPFVEAMEAETQEATAESDDALVVRTLVDLALEEVDSVQTLGDADVWEGLTIPLSDVRDRFNSMTDRDVGSSYIGQVRKRLGIEKVRRSDGVAIRDDDLERKLRDLCEQNNLAFEHSGTHDPVHELDEAEKSRGPCSLCGERRTRTHQLVPEGGYICGECAAEEENALE